MKQRYEDKNLKWYDDEVVETKKCEKCGDQATVATVIAYLCEDCFKRGEY